MLKNWRTNLTIFESFKKCGKYKKYKIFSCSPSTRCSGRRQESNQKYFGIFFPNKLRYLRWRRFIESTRYVRDCLAAAKNCNIAFRFEMSSVVSRKKRNSKSLQFQQSKAPVEKDTVEQNRMSSVTAELSEQLYCRRKWFHSKIGYQKIKRKIVENWHFLITKKQTLPWNALSFPTTTRLVFRLYRYYYTKLRTKRKSISEVQLYYLAQNKLFAENWAPAYKLCNETLFNYTSRNRFHLEHSSLLKNIWI